MKHKRATDYGGRTPRGFWIESAFIALIALAFVAALLAMVAHAQPVSSTDIRVVDGDTIALSGLRQHVRLVGFNAPETRNTGCEAEAQLGQRAKQRLQVLVDTGSLELTFIACSCPPRTEGRRDGKASCPPMRQNTRVGAEGLSDWIGAHVDALHVTLAECDNLKARGHRQPAVTSRGAGAEATAGSTPETVPARHRLLSRARAAYEMFRATLLRVMHSESPANRGAW